MKKLFYILFYSSLLGENEIQNEFYASLKQINYDENLVVLTIFALIFITIAVIFLIKVVHVRSIDAATSIKELNYVAKLNFNYGIYKNKKSDIVQSLEGYFDILHMKAAKGSNKVLFSFNQNQQRNFIMNLREINFTLFSLAEFLLENTTNSIISIGLKPIDLAYISKDGKKMRKYYFYVRVNKNLEALKNEIKDVVFNNMKDLKFKNLVQANNFAKEFGYSIDFKTYEKFSSFSFCLELIECENSKKNHKSILSNKNCIILEDDVNAFSNLALTLRRYGVGTQPFLNVQTAKKHIFNAIYKPDFVIINTKFFRLSTKNAKAFTKDEINSLLRIKQNKGFTLIIISDNADHDDFSSKIKDYYLLKQPFSPDLLLSILKTKKDIDNEKLKF